MSGLAKVFRVQRRAAVSTLLILALAGCATPASREPANLSTLKREITHYVDSGEHQRQVAAVAARAQAWLEERAARRGAGERLARRGAGERLAVIFDVDETMLFNWETMTGADFGYVPAVWDAWVFEARAPVIEPVLAVYRTARRLGIEVVFITGRPQTQHAATERNLRAVGCDDFLVLICKPVTPKQPSGAYKLAERQRLTAEGLTIVANLGDQQSDFFGGVSERDFKLPAPFYITE